MTFNTHRQRISLVSNDCQ